MATCGAFTLMLVSTVSNVSVEKLYFNNSVTFLSNQNARTYRLSSRLHLPRLRRVPNLRMGRTAHSPGNSPTSNGMIDLVVSLKLRSLWTLLPLPTRSVSPGRSPNSFA